MSISEKINKKTYIIQKNYMNYKILLKVLVLNQRLYQIKLVNLLTKRRLF